MRLHLALLFLVLSLGLLLPVSALPDPINSTEGLSEDVEEKLVLQDASSDPVVVAPKNGDQKAVIRKDPLSMIHGEATPEQTASPPDKALATTEPAPGTTAIPAPTAALTRESTSDQFPLTNGSGDDETEEPALRLMSTEAASLTPSSNTTPPASTATVTATADEPGDEDESGDEVAEATPPPVPTLQKYAPPRPSATMAKAHQSHGRPLPQGDHQIVTSASPLKLNGSSTNETETPPSLAMPHEGLIIRGVGVILDRTPEDVPLTRRGVQIASLDWLLDPGMTLGGRHPRAVFEGETFTVTVTVEARNLSAIKEGEGYVVLVPPPVETGVYEITRIREPASLQDGERGVWEFSVTTRTGRLALANLTLPEERLITDLTRYPDLFAFRAYSFAGDQRLLSSGVSDPVLSIRPDGDIGAAEERSLPAIYALAGLTNSTLHPSETIPEAWARGLDHDTIVVGAVGHLDHIKTLGKEEVTAIYTEEEMTGPEGQAQVGSSSSPFEMFAEFFRTLLGWVG